MDNLILNLLPYLHAAIMDYIESRKNSISTLRKSFVENEENEENDHIYGFENLINSAYDAFNLGPCSILRFLIEDHITQIGKESFSWQDLLKTVFYIAAGLFSAMFPVFLPFLSLNVSAIETSFEVYKAFKEFNVNSAAYRLGFTSVEPSSMQMVYASAGFLANFITSGLSGEFHAASGVLSGESHAMVGDPLSAAEAKAAADKAATAQGPKSQTKSYSNAYSERQEQLYELQRQQQVQQRLEREERQLQVQEPQGHQWPQVPQQPQTKMGANRPGKFFNPRGRNKKAAIDRGLGIKFTDENGIERIRLMREKEFGQYVHEEEGYWVLQSENGYRLNENGEVPCWRENGNLRALQEDRRVDVRIDPARPNYLVSGERFREIDPMTNTPYTFEEARFWTHITVTNP